MASPDSPLAKKMRYELERYYNLRQHDASQIEYKNNFIALQKWQAQRLKTTHSSLLNNPVTRDATEFFLTDIYGGIDLTDLARDVERVLFKALRVLPEKVMETSALAMELNALTADLDERVTDILFYDYKVSAITDEAYCEAFRQACDKSLRQHQAQMMAQLGRGLDKYVRSRLVFGAYKLARKPAENAGLRALTGFLDRGFKVMRPMESTEKLMCAIVDVETELFDRIYAGHAAPFSLIAEHKF